METIMSGLCEGVEGVGGDLSNVCIIYMVCCEDSSRGELLTQTIIISGVVTAIL